MLGNGSTQPGYLRLAGRSAFWGCLSVPVSIDSAVVVWSWCFPSVESDKGWLRRCERLCLGWRGVRCRVHQFAAKLLCNINAGCRIGHLVGQVCMFVVRVVHQ